MGTLVVYSVLVLVALAGILELGQYIIMVSAPTVHIFPFRLELHTMENVFASLAMRFLQVLTPIHAIAAFNSVTTSVLHAVVALLCLQTELLPLQDVRFVAILKGSFIYLMIHVFSVHHCRTLMAWQQLLGVVAVQEFGILSYPNAQLLHAQQDLSLIPKIKYAFVTLSPPLFLDQRVYFAQL
jgi:hypothetical protein